MDERLEALAKQYRDTCDAFDNAWCSAPPREPGGSNMPANDHERMVMARNSRNVLARILIENPDIRRRDLQDAIQRTALCKK